MKKVLVALMCLLSVTVFSQNKGRFEVYDYSEFKLHVYYTNDVMDDASFIIEGNSALVTLEEPLFKDNVAEFDAYVANLKKPVAQRIADYHLGGTGNHEIVMPEGMAEFTKGPVYGGMMKGFAEAFGDAIVSLPDGKTTEVAFGKTQTFAGVQFYFTHGASSDFPAASILIGKKIYFTHWASLKAHVSHLYISSAEAADARIASLEEALQSGAELFVGAHGGAVKQDAVRFRIDYLKKIKSLLGTHDNAASFVSALKEAYPGLPGEEGLDALAKTLYK